MAGKYNTAFAMPMPQPFMFAWLMRFGYQRFFTFSALFFGILLLETTNLLTSCANIAPPMGGPKDTLPPLLLKAAPADSTLNFSDTRIEFSFNEYVQLDNVFENVLVNPPLNRFPTIDSRLRTVSVIIKDTLQENTTYSIDFGNAIKDVNEGNPLKAFTYVFSTGNHLDSLELTGTVINAETGLPDSTLIAILHTSEDDSAVAKLKPAYVARLNGKGDFRFRFLPAKTFRVFALKDEGFKQYQDGETPFAFADEAVNPADNPPPLALRFFTVPDTAQQDNTGTTAGGSRLGAKKKKEGEEDEMRKLAYSTSIKANRQDILQPLSINFQEPLANWDSTKISLTDTLYKRQAVGSFSQDSVTISLPVVWKSNTPYLLILERGFASDSAGLTINKNDTIPFTTKAESEYGAVRMNFSGIDYDKKPLLLWLQNNAVAKKSILKPGELRIALIAPGEYTLRIVYDENENGNWDTGNYWQKLQPERVIAFPKPISIRPNWDNEFQFDF